MSAPDKIARSFAQCRDNWLRLSGLLAKAKTPAEFRALLLADAAAPYHSYNILALVTELNNLADNLTDWVYDGLDEDGAPL